MCKIDILLCSLQHPELCTSPVPVAEMISSDQGTSEMTHFLNKWILTSKLILHKDINIDQVEMDYSWPLSYILGFVGNTIDSLLDVNCFCFKTLAQISL